MAGWKEVYVAWPLLNNIHPDICVHILETKELWGSRGEKNRESD